MDLSERAAANDGSTLPVKRSTTSSKARPFELVPFRYFVDSAAQPVPKLAAVCQHPP